MSVFSHFLCYHEKVWLNVRQISIRVETWLWWHYISITKCHLSHSYNIWYFRMLYPIKHPQPYERVVLGSWRSRSQFISRPCTNMIAHMIRSSVFNETACYTKYTKCYPLQGIWILCSSECVYSPFCNAKEYGEFFCCCCCFNRYYDLMYADVHVIVCYFFFLCRTLLILTRTVWGTFRTQSMTILCSLLVKWVRLIIVPVV